MARYEGARKTGQAIVVCTTPDVCKTPMGNSTPPVPYQITANFSDSTSVSPNVRFGGDPAFILDQSIITKVTGDEPGTAGGVKSGTNVNIVEPVEASGTVRVNKKRVVRHNDACRMNNGNTMGRVVYQPGGGEGEISAARPETAEEARKAVEKKGLWSKMSGVVHGALDVAGFIPLLGAAPDLANAGIYALEGNAVEAGISAVAAIPGFGDGVKAGALVVKSGKAVAKKVAKEAAEKAAKEAAEKAAKEAAEKAAEKAAKKQGKENVHVKDKKKACRYLENGVPGSRYRGGKYSKIKPGGLSRSQEAHHMPADCSSPVKTASGPAIQMDKADHRMTASCDTNNPAHIALQKSLASKGRAGMLAAMMMDIKDIRGKFGNKYDSSLAQMMAYAKCMGYI